ncbi:hypothetical protein EG68_11517 [Paragonimus skrjabini miyazakii]|uniref:WW domain-containing protein n=1 Tax=Paragonimus skrjabini miyazakii TaxID=59628 RepID=A0A8S9YBE9_9TREM|nr:hypothetical protein EG68_11517 [Paragonimus skrjabini miyazakii]
MAFDGPVVITLDEYSFISDGRKVTIPKGEVLLVISRPNERWSLVTRSAGSLKFFIPTRILENISKDVTGRGTATYCIPPVDLPSEIFEDQVYHHSTQMSCHLDNPSTPETPVSNDERRISDCDQATCRSPSNADVSSEADHPNLRVVESQTKGLNVSTQPSNIPDSVAGSTDKVSWRRLRDGDQELYVNQLTAEMWAPAVDAHGRTYYYEVNSRNSVWELENLNDCEDGDEPSHHTVYDAVYSGTDKEDDKLDESGRLLPSSNTPAVASSVDRPRPKVRNSPRLNVTTIHCLFSDASKSSQSFDSVSPTDVDAPASDDPEGSGRFALARIGKEHISGPLENKLVNFERRCMVRRTKYIENDRRLPKRWSDALLLLSGPWLLFYKDAKSALPVSRLGLNRIGKFYRFSSSITGHAIQLPCDLQTGNFCGLRLSFVDISKCIGL